MGNADTTHVGDTIRIRRPSMVTTDETGRTIWMREVDPCALELDSGVETDPYDKTGTFELKNDGIFSK